jgi:glycosyl transferase family 25
MGGRLLEFMNHSQSFWDQIDAILVINLKHRTDRWDRINRMLQDQGVADKVIKIEAVEGNQLAGFGSRPWFRKNSAEKLLRMKAGAAGCCLSHRKAIETAQQRQCKRVLILEDDALFSSNATDESMDFIGTFLGQQPSVDMFYLGFYQKHCLHQPVAEKVIDDQALNIWRIRGPLMLHAVVIDKRIYPKLLDGLPTEKNIWPWMTYWGSIDAWIQNKFGRDSTIKIYGCRPSIVVQQANFSDICGRVLTVEESEGTHRPMQLKEVTEGQIQKLWPLSLGERIYQGYKRGQRLVRAYLFGYHKT